MLFLNPVGNKDFFHIERISNLILRGYVTVRFGRALEWHSRGQRFDPAYLHHRNGLKRRFQAVFVRFSIRQEIIDILSHSVISGLKRGFSALFVVHLQ